MVLFRKNMFLSTLDGPNPLRAMPASSQAWGLNLQAQPGRTLGVCFNKIPGRFKCFHTLFMSSLVVFGVAYNVFCSV